MIETLAQEAAAHWGGTPLRLIRNRENAVFEMELPGGERAALRLHRQGYQPDAAIRSELWWCAALAARGVNVPAALPARDGTLLVTLSNGRAASAIDWIEGEPLGEAGVPFSTPLPLLLQRHRQLGKLIRDLHDTTAALDLPEGFQRPRWDLDGLTGEAPFWGRFWDHPAATSGQRAMLIRARHGLRERLAAVPEVQLIHADVLRENVLVNDRAVCLIDFDDSGWGYALYDLGTTLSQNLYEPGYQDIRDALMEGYGTTDTDLVELMTLARTCASVGWTMPRLAADDPIHPSHIARAVMWAERVL
ncbi:MAG: phosphotransferase [Rhodobacter sp.]|nr:phosphotransferase [Rhodobacter sp.]MBK8440786.1 phosphotransferase [Rhodobacter sp.]